MAGRLGRLFALAAIVSACATEGGLSSAVVPSARESSITSTPTADLGLPLLAEQPTWPELLEPGTYLIDAPFPVRASLTVPEGWSVDSSRVPWERAVGLGVLTDTGQWAGWGLAFKDIDNVFVDPCATGQRLRDIGPTADDLVAAFLDLPGYEVADPVPVTVGGIAGQRIDIHVPELDAAACPGGHLIWTMGGITKRGQPGNDHNLIVLEVNDRRLVIEVDDYAHTSVYETETWHVPFDPEAHAQDLVELDQILDSIEFH
jgi:hypothetical protein